MDRHGHYLSTDGHRPPLSGLPRHCKKMICQNTGCRGAENWYVPGEMSSTTDLYPKRRRSASADAALRAEIRRVEKMTIEERMRSALSMDVPFQSLPITPQDRRKDVGPHE